MAGPSTNGNTPSPDRNDWDRLSMMDDVTCWVRAHFGMLIAFQINSMLIKTAAVSDFLQHNDAHDYSMLHIFVSSAPDGAKDDVVECLCVMDSLSSCVDHHVAIRVERGLLFPPPSVEVFDLITFTIL